MGNILNSAVFLPPCDISKNFLSKCKLVKTKHGSNILLKEIPNNDSKLYIIFSHGNSETIENSYYWCYYGLKNLVKANIVVYEYTGYCTNYKNRNDKSFDFKPSEKYTYNDIEAVYQYLTNQKSVDPKNIILIGRSLGSGPSCYLAEKIKDIGGLIIISGFTSILRVALNLRFSLFFDMYSNIERIPNIDCPIMIIHSLNDELISFQHAIDLYDKCKNQYDPLFIKGTGHNDVERVGSVFYEKINDFIKYISKD